MSFQLGSITSEQIQRTTARPITRDDLLIEEIEDIDVDTKDMLQKKGITSVRDLEKLEQEDVAVEKVVAGTKAARGTSYENLANIINRARRGRLAPRVSRISFGKDIDSTVLTMEGENLSLAGGYRDFPVAQIDGKEVPIVGASPSEVRLEVSPEQLEGRNHELQMALDPFAVVKMSLKTNSPIWEAENESEQR
jgi:hypothetical protein